jgi:hypothetical protein
MSEVALGVAGLPSDPLRAVVAELRLTTLRKHLTSFLTPAGGIFRLRRMGRSDHDCCQGQSWSQFWSQNGMVTGVSVLPTLLVKFNGRENRISGTQ